MGNDSLRMANTFRFRDIMDAVYYIMACREMLDLDPAGNELLIAGDESLRDEITPILRKFLGYVSAGGSARLRAQGRRAMGKKLRLT